MDMEKIQEDKEQLSRDILSLIRDFQRKTSIKVSSVEYTSIINGIAGDPSVHNSPRNLKQYYSEIHSQFSSRLLFQSRKYEAFAELYL